MRWEFRTAAVVHDEKYNAIKSRIYVGENLLITMLLKLMMSHIFMFAPFPHSTPSNHLNEVFPVPLGNDTEASSLAPPCPKIN